MAHIHENTRARRQALQLLYQNELMEDVELPEGEEGAEGAEGAARAACALPLVISELPAGAEETEVLGEKVKAYAESLAEGVSANIARIDAWISSTAENWKLDRMPIVDRNIIRLAAYEIGYCDDIPAAVAINEAVEVAKAFGGDDSPKFVNGVLGRIADIVEREGVQPVEEAAPEADGEPEGEGAGDDGAAVAADADAAGVAGDVDAAADADGDAVAAADAAAATDEAAEAAADDAADADTVAATDDAVADDAAGADNVAAAAVTVTAADETDAAAEITAAAEPGEAC